MLRSGTSCLWQRNAFVLCLVVLLSWLVVHELCHLRHQVVFVLVEHGIRRSRPCLGRSLVLVVHFLLICLLTSGLGSRLDLRRLHLDRLVTSLFLPLECVLLHQGLHTAILILEEDFFLVKIGLIENRRLPYYL